MEWDKLWHEVSTCPTFDLFLSIIPTRSSNPMAYLPKFSLVCAPDNALNIITSDLNFHTLSFTSIQWAVIPRKPIFVMSADHASAVIETFPSAAYSSYKWWVIDIQVPLLTIISCFTCCICFENSLWIYIFTSYAVGRSAVVDLGLIETRLLRNAALSASARA